LEKVSLHLDTHFWKGVDQAKDLLKYDSKLPFEELLEKLLAFFTLSTKTEWQNRLTDVEKKNLSLEDSIQLHNKRKNEEVFGFSCAIYCNFLPKFITSVNARFMGDLWGCIKLSKLPDRFKSSMSHLVETLEDKQNQLNKEKVHIDTKINDLKETMKKLQSSNFFKFDSSIKKRTIIQSTKNIFNPKQI